MAFRPVRMQFDYWINGIIIEFQPEFDGLCFWPMNAPKLPDLLASCSCFAFWRLAYPPTSFMNISVDSNETLSSAIRRTLKYRRRWQFATAETKLNLKFSNLCVQNCQFCFQLFDGVMNSLQRFHGLFFKYKRKLIGVRVRHVATGHTISSDRINCGLKLLFFGSDSFSLASLNRLNDVRWEQAIVKPFRIYLTFCSEFAGKQIHGR